LTDLGLAVGLDTSLNKIIVKIHKQKTVQNRINVSKMIMLKVY